MVVYYTVYLITLDIFRLFVLTFLSLLVDCLIDTIVMLLFFF